MAVETDNLPLAFDLWAVTAPPVEEGLSFGLPDSAGMEIALWELDLPEDPDAASSVVQSRGEFIRASQDALEAAPDDIERFVEKMGAAPLGEVSYGMLPEQQLSPAEQDALRMLTYLEMGPDEVSFAAAEQSETELEQASGQFQEAVERMLKLVSHFAWVDTKVAGRLSCRTIVSWSGDMGNVWADQADGGVYGLHQQSVRQALASRNIVVHACIATAQSAAKLAVLLTNPAGAIIALPVAWKLVRQILEDVEKYRNITNQEINHAE